MPRASSTTPSRCLLSPASIRLRVYPSGMSAKRSAIVGPKVVYSPLAFMGIKNREAGMARGRNRTFPFFTALLTARSGYWLDPSILARGISGSGTFHWSFRPDAPRISKEPPSST